MRRGKRKGGGRRKECIERGNISHRRKGARDRRGQKGKRGANMKSDRRGNIKKGEKEDKRKRVEGAKEGT
jgi:hypothetical protein